MTIDVSAMPMLLQSPFHSRVHAVCETNAWTEWHAYSVARSYYDVELEYFAIRNSTGVFDLSPMIKYRISGPDAEKYLNRLLSRDVRKIGVSRVGYALWCDEAGQVLDDGTLFHLAEQDYRLCTSSHGIDWLLWSAMGFDVSIIDESSELAALAVQGPTSYSVLQAMGLNGLEQLKPFGLMRFEFDGHTLLVSRTGFTGDLGYELWIEPKVAETLWDALFVAGQHYMIRPVGEAAYDLARIEAGFLQAGVDFVPAEHCVRYGRSRSPYELGLDWLVDLDKPMFNGRKALSLEQQRGSRYKTVLLDVAGNKPAEHSFVYRGRKRVGTVTSAAWCPTSKSNVAIACVDAKYANPGSKLVAEVYYQRELQWTRLMASCTVLDGPLFNPGRRRQTPAPKF